MVRHFSLPPWLPQFSRSANQRKARSPGAKKYSPPRVTTKAGRPCSRRRIGCCGMVKEPLPPVAPVMGLPTVYQAGF